MIASENLRWLYRQVRHALEPQYPLQADESTLPPVQALDKIFDLALSGEAFERGETRAEHEQEEESQ